MTTESEQLKKSILVCIIDPYCNDLVTDGDNPGCNRPEGHECEAFKKWMESRE